MSAAIRINLAADTALPQRDLLLDADEVARRFSRQLGADGPVKIDNCERARVKYSPGASLRVLYRIQVAGTLFTVATRAFTNGRSKSAFERAAKKTFSCGPLLPVAYDGEMDSVYWTFPNDRKITNLAMLANPPETIANLCNRRWTRSRVVAYAPEKCATAACLSDNYELLAYAKIYSSEERPSFDIYNTIGRNARDSKSSLIIPRALAYSRQDRALLLEAIAGVPVAELSVANRPDGFRLLGRALAALNSIPVPDALPRFARFDLGQLQEGAEVIGQVCLEATKMASRLAEELCETWEPSTEPDVCLHGDAHPKNAIIQGDRLALIDLDQAATGQSAADVGSVLASLRYLRCVGALSQGAERRLGSAFLSGYSEVRNLPSADSLNWHMAAALLAERALRAVSRIRLEGLARMSDLLTSARKLLRKDCELDY